MPELQIKKVVAVCFLEATRLTLEQVGTYRLELSQQGRNGHADLARLYGDLRRLRDYLQRCISACHDDVKVDFPEGDARLLVACCCRAVESIEYRLSERALTAEERDWLQRKRTVLADWAVEIAVKPLLELPLARLLPMPTEFVRSLTSRLQHRVYGDVRDRAKIMPPATSAASGLAGVLVPMAGEASAAAEPAPPPAGALLGRSDQTLAPTEDAGADPPASLIEPRNLRDPRLRALVALDLGSYERVAAAGDHRLATILLASIVECALLDHAISRRVELGLSGSPDAWNASELLLKALGELAGPKDRALAYHLFASRNLLRPAQQMVNPAVITADSFRRMREFAERALHGLGFGGRGQPVASDEESPGLPADEPAPDDGPKAAAGPRSDD